MLNIKSYFDVIAADYDKRSRIKPGAKEIDLIVEELDLPVGSRILDVGCGTGRHAIELAKRGFVVTGVDFSEQMLAIASAKSAVENLSIEWICTDARTFLRTDGFDAAISFTGGAFGVLDSTDDPVQSDLLLLESLYKNLLAGGVLLVEAISASFQVRNVDVRELQSGEFNLRDMTVRGPGYRERCYVPTEIKLLFRYAGFKVLHIWGRDKKDWYTGRRSLNIGDELMLVVARKR